MKFKKDENLPVAIYGYDNTKDFLNPAINNIGFKGILKTSKEMQKWFANSKDFESEF